MFLPIPGYLQVQNWTLKANFIPEDGLRLAETRSYVFFLVALRLNASHGLLMLEVSRPHTTQHSR